MSRRTLLMSTVAAVGVATLAGAVQLAANHLVKPCAAKNPCAAVNPCNPCAAANPCSANPCAPKKAIWDVATPGGAPAGQ